MIPKKINNSEGTISDELSTLLKSVFEENDTVVERQNEIILSSLRKYIPEVDASNAERLLKGRLSEVTYEFDPNTTCYFLDKDTPQQVCFLIMGKVFPEIEVSDTGTVKAELSFRYAAQ